MMDFTLDEDGFEIVEEVYSEDEINDILLLINSLDLENQFGIREFLSDYPDIAQKVFNAKLIEIVSRVSPECHQSIKSIYFDKPPSANWVVNWHQDLTINVSHKKEFPHFRNWRVQKERTTVQPSKEILESIFTIRIHLDDCISQNGALRVIEKSHKKGVVEIKDWIKNKIGIERICEVGRGGVLLMKPLILHSSKRSENQMNRRVIHIEFIDEDLPNGLNWKEKIDIKKYRCNS